MKEEQYECRQKQSVLKKVTGIGCHLPVLMSDCTRMPFVVCGSGDDDDEVFIFFSEEDVQCAEDRNP